MSKIRKKKYNLIHLYCWIVSHCSIFLLLMPSDHGKLQPTLEAKLWQRLSFNSKTRKRIRNHKNTGSFAINLAFSELHRWESPSKVGKVDSAESLILGSETDWRGNSKEAKSVMFKSNVRQLIWRLGGVNTHKAVIGSK